MTALFFCQYQRRVLVRSHIPGVTAMGHSMDDITAELCAKDSVLSRRSSPHALHSHRHRHTIFSVWLERSRPLSVTRR